MSMSRRHTEDTNDSTLARLFLEGKNCFNCHHMYDCKDLKGPDYVCLRYEEEINVPTADMVDALILFSRIKEIKLADSSEENG